MSLRSVSVWLGDFLAAAEKAVQGGVKLSCFLNTLEFAKSLAHRRITEFVL